LRLFFKDNHPTPPDPGLEISELRRVFKLDKPIKESKMLSKLRTALRTLFRRTEVERELDEELRHHIDQQTEQNIRLGMSPGDARQAALKSFGGVEQAKERSRDARGVRRFEELWQDLCYGARMCCRTPASR
jgi:hypothetical protein